MIHAIIRMVIDKKSSDVAASGHRPRIANGEPPAHLILRF